MHIAISSAGIVRIQLPQKLHDTSPAPSNEEAPPPEVVGLWSVVNPMLDRGWKRRLDLNPIALVKTGTPFQRNVWRAIAAIPPGETQTYGTLATNLGNPGAARAVGTACGRNPFPLLIPCHRVVAAGTIGGFSGDLAIKSALLALEAGSA